jgi:ketosteroid isomerase-like protein
MLFPLFAILKTAARSSTPLWLRWYRFRLMQPWVFRSHPHSASRFLYVGDRNYYSSTFMRKPSTMKKHVRQFPLLFLLLLALAGCQSAPHEHAEAGPNMDSVRTLIAAMADEYAAAENARDAERLSRYYAEDAIIMPSGKPAVVGREQIKAALQADMDSSQAGSKISFANTGLWAQGNLIVETGTSTWTDSAGAVIFTGKYMTVYEKRDGKYIAIRDIWNEDK